MDDNLRTLLELMATDPAARAAVAADPQGAAARYRLTAEQAGLLQTLSVTDDGGPEVLAARLSKTSLFGGVGRVMAFVDHSDSGVSVDTHSSVLADVQSSTDPHGSAGAHTSPTDPYDGTVDSGTVLFTTSLLDGPPDHVGTDGTIGDGHGTVDTDGSTAGPTIDGPTSDGPTSDGPTADGPLLGGPTTDGPTDGPAAGSAVIDVSGGYTRYAFNADGSTVENTTEPNGDVLVTATDANGMITSTSTVVGGADQLGAPGNADITFTDGGATTVEHTDSGTVIQVDNDNGGYTRTAFNNDGSTITNVANADGSIDLTSTDAQGNTVSGTIDASPAADITFTDGGTTSIEHTDGGTVIQVDSTDGGYTRTAFNNDGSTVTNVVNSDGSIDVTLTDAHGTSTSTTIAADGTPAPADTSPAPTDTSPAPSDDGSTPSGTADNTGTGPSDSSGTPGSTDDGSGPAPDTTSGTPDPGGNGTGGTAMGDDSNGDGHAGPPAQTGHTGSATVPSSGDGDGPSVLTSGGKGSVHSGDSGGPSLLTGVGKGSGHTGDDDQDGGPAPQVDTTSAPAPHDESTNPLSPVYGKADPSVLGHAIGAGTAHEPISGQIASTTER